MRLSEPKPRSANDSSLMPNAAAPSPPQCLARVAAKRTVARATRPPGSSSAQPCAVPDAPSSSADGGQLFLRALDGDSALLGNSFAEGGYAAKLVTGTYGVYYRSQASVTMPQNNNGRLTCFTVE